MTDKPLTAVAAMTMIAVPFQATTTPHVITNAIMQPRREVVTMLCMRSSKRSTTTSR